MTFYDLTLSYDGQNMQVTVEGDTPDEAIENFHVDCDVWVEESASETERRPFIVLCEEDPECDGYCAYHHCYH